MIQEKRWGRSIAPFLYALVFATLSQPCISPSYGQHIAQVPMSDSAILKEVFPAADIFSIKGGRLPHHKAYKSDPETGINTLVGVIFLTAEVEPDEFAYGGPIYIMVGLTTGGIITKVRIVEHYEPYGYFSIDPPEFADQFEGKSILDRFEEGRDIDSVTTATITVDGAARVIKKSARKIARRYLAPKKK